MPNPGNARVNDINNTVLMEAIRDNNEALVQEILTEVPGKSPASLDLANDDGYRAIHYAAEGYEMYLNQNEIQKKIRILGLLIDAGANIEVLTNTGYTPLGLAVYKSNADTVLNLLQRGASMTNGNEYTKPYKIAFGLEPNELGYIVDNFIVIPRMFVENNIFDSIDDNEFRLIVLNVIYQIITENKPELLMEILEKLPEKTINSFDIKSLDRIALINNIDLMKLVIEKGAVGKTGWSRVVEKANQAESEYSDEMKDLILEIASAQPEVPAGPQPMWKGWTKGDLGQFNTVFEADAFNYSICPVCFKFTYRQDGCMYMHHDCLDEQRLHGGFVHKQLYEKYQGADGQIWWCTVCSRICKGHVHYELAPPFIDAPRTVAPEPGANLFGNNCLGANKGGGVPEKVARFRRARQYALELQDEINQITEEDAMKQLVEEMWIAPIARYNRPVRKILTNRAFNIPNTNFPPNAPPPAAAAANNAPAPNIVNPGANNAALRPEIVEAADLTNVMTLNDIPKGILFHHRKPDGTIFNHDAPIGRPGLIAWFDREGSGMAYNFTDPHFGKCFERDCDAVFYPQELEPFVDTAEEERFIPRDLFEAYRANFNRHMPAKLAAAAGGSRRRRGKTRKAKKQRGGQPHNMFLEADLGQCLLPRRGTSKGGRRRHRRSKTRKVRKHR